MQPRLHFRFVLVKYSSVFLDAKCQYLLTLGPKLYNSNIFTNVCSTTSAVTRLTVLHRFELLSCSCFCDSCPLPQCSSSQFLWGGWFWAGGPLNRNLWRRGENILCWKIKCLYFQDLKVSHFRYLSDLNSGWVLASGVAICYPNICQSYQNDVRWGPKSQFFDFSRICPESF